MHDFPLCYLICSDIILQVFQNDCSSKLLIFKTEIRGSFWHVPSVCLRYCSHLCVAQMFRTKENIASHYCLSLNSIYCLFKKVHHLLFLSV